MKQIMPFFAACALLAGTACSTYTSSTDPTDTGSGTALTEEVTTTTTAAPSATAPAPVATDSTNNTEVPAAGH